MATPQRKPRGRPLVEWTVPDRPEARGAPPGKAPKRASDRAPRHMPGWDRRRGVWLGARSKRAFVVLVVPVLLMLGSVYAHTVAAGLKGEAARLEEERITAEGEGERLEVRITELSESGNVRTQARDLGMKDPGAQDFETYGSVGEDVVDGGGEKKTGEKEVGQ